MYNVTRRHRRSITVLILITALSVSACTAPRAWEMNKTQTAHEKTQSSELNGADMSIGEAATLLLESDCAAFSSATASDTDIPGQGTTAVSIEEAALEISGMYISKQYLAFRAALYAKTSSEKDPVNAAEDLIKKQVAEWNFAQKKGLLPTDDEVMSYCGSMRSDAESDIESRETMLVVVQNMGLNEAEYFRVFLPRYEVPFILVSENVNNYCSEHDKAMPDRSSESVKIIDEQYISELQEYLK